MKRAVVSNWFLVWLCCLLWVTPNALAKEPELVLAGEVNSETGSIRFAGGTLFRSGSATFPTYEAASQALQTKGISSQAASDFIKRLRESVEALTKGTRSYRGATVRDSSARAISLLSVQKLHDNVYRFDVYTGPPPTIIKFAELDECRALNSKCFICSDNKIRCLLSALTTEEQQQ